MKNIFIFIFLIISSCSIWKYDEVIKRKPPHPCPPGTVWLKDNLYFDETEVANVHWREYLYWTKRVYVDGYEKMKDSCCHPEKYLSQLPDTMSWLRLNVENKNRVPFAAYYFKYPPYDYYPVVGISYEQAEAYCKWRSDRVNESMKIWGGEKNVGIKYPHKVIYRLPTESEWEYAASGGLNLDTFQFGRERLTDKHGITIGNTLTYSDIYINDTSKNHRDITAPIFSFSPNKFGLYNMIGNVAEMVSEKGIAKGGSFIHSLEESQIKKEITYTQPECWLGFRCICEVEW